MKQLILLLIITFSLSTFAEESLKDTMKQMGKIFKALGISAVDPKQNAQSAQATEKLVALIDKATKQPPDIIDTLPDDQKKTAKDDYNRMINQELDAAKALHQAFLKNDNATAVKILKQMAQTKQEGHEEFNN